MARERQVTRTINAIEVVAICMSIKDMTPCEKTLSLTGDTFRELLQSPERTNFGS